MIASEPQPNLQQPAPAFPPQDVIAVLAHFYCLAGLPPRAAWRSALADYECFFRSVGSLTT